MRTEDEIKKKIEEIKQGILENVLAGIIIEKAIQNDAMWIEVLEWDYRRITNERNRKDVRECRDKKD